jgi:hypothetical protein
MLHHVFSLNYIKKKKKKTVKKKFKPSYLKLLLNIKKNNKITKK